MGRAARVHSIDAVQEMAAAITTFRGEASAALDELDMEIRRALEWIHHDRKEHWSEEVRRGWQRITESRIQLQQAQMSRRIAEHEPSCYDEKKALERSKRRLDVAQAKVEIVRHWVHAIDHAVNEYRGSRTALTGWLDADVPGGLAALSRITRTLEAYLAIATQGGEMPMPLELDGSAGAAMQETDAGAVADVAERAVTRVQGDGPIFVDTKTGTVPEQTPPAQAEPPEHPEENAP